MAIQVGPCIGLCDSTYIIVLSVTESLSLQHPHVTAKYVFGGTQQSVAHPLPSMNNGVAAAGPATGFFNLPVCSRTSHSAHSNGSPVSHASSLRWTKPL